MSESKIRNKFDCPSSEEREREVYYIRLEVKARMPVGQCVPDTHYKHSNSRENIKLNKITMELTITITMERERERGGRERQTDRQRHRETERDRVV